MKFCFNATSWFYHLVSLKQVYILSTTLVATGDVPHGVMPEIYMNLDSNHNSATCYICEMPCMSFNFTDLSCLICEKQITERNNKDEVNDEDNGKDANPYSSFVHIRK